jgi:hypothetical protein
MDQEKFDCSDMGASASLLALASFYQNALPGRISRLEVPVTFDLGEQA